MTMKARPQVTYVRHGPIIVLKNTRRRVGELIPGQIRPASLGRPRSLDADKASSLTILAFTSWTSGRLLSKVRALVRGRHASSRSARAALSSSCSGRLGSGEPRRREYAARRLGST